MHLAFLGAEEGTNLTRRDALCVFTYLYDTIEPDGTVSPRWASRIQKTFFQTGPTPVITVGCFMQMLPLLLLHYKTH